jgi:hypothetical protein
MYVEEGHDEIGSVRFSKMVGDDDVRSCSEEIAVGQRDTLGTG